MKSNKLVTKDSIVCLLNNPNRKFVEAVIGRAISALYKRQTTSEQNNHTTKEANGVGFTSYDAEVGSKTAELWKAKGALEFWMVRYWTKKGKAGFPAVSRYHKQLNEIALEKLNGA